MSPFTSSATAFFMAFTFVIGGNLALQGVVRDRQLRSLTADFEAAKRMLDPDPERGVPYEPVEALNALRDVGAEASNIKDISPGEFDQDSYRQSLLRAYRMNARYYFDEAKQESDEGGSNQSDLAAAQFYIDHLGGYEPANISRNDFNAVREAGRANDLRYSSPWSVSFVAPTH